MNNKRLLEVSEILSLFDLLNRYVDEVIPSSPMETTNDFIKGIFHQHP